MLYLFAAAVVAGSWIGYRRTPEHETLARLLFRLGMAAGIAVAVLGYIVFNVVEVGGRNAG